MIIKKKNSKENIKEGTAQKKQTKSKIIKAGSVKPVEQDKPQEPEIEAEVPVIEEEKNEPLKSELELKIEEYEKIDVTVAEFSERYERRRGERRRGFRRIDERTLVSRAQEEARNIREVAAKEGYKNGLNEAQNEIDNIKTQIENFINIKNEVYEELSSHILEIALAVAKKIIKKEVELSNEVLKAVMSEVFSELSSGEEKVIVKVNPEDVDFAKASLPEILENSAIDAKITVTAEKLVERGSCTVIASNGVVDANFSTQLSIIQNAFGIYKGGE